MKTALLVIVLTALFSGSLFGQGNFEIVIERKLSSAACTLGYLIADKKVICHTLELPWENNIKISVVFLPDPITVF